MDLCWQSNGSGFQHAVSLQLFIFLSSFHETDPVYFISLKIMFYLRTGIILYGMDIGIRLFLLWLHPFILSGVISRLISCSNIGHLPTWGAPLSVSCLFAFSYCSWGSQGRTTEVVCHSLLQWTTFCQTSPPWPACLGWPHMAWLSFIELDKAVVHKSP